MVQGAKKITEGHEPLLSAPMSYGVDNIGSDRYMGGSK